eukprot:13514053-Alexandrium_andersonii.AAC.1
MGTPIPLAGAPPGPAPASVTEQLAAPGSSAGARACGGIMAGGPPGASSACWSRWSAAEAWE